ncbi:hypothetical protein BDE36_2487 [Arcticibacter tournemirensis]|nr:hypothetical protein BDE36_2487 [Arcticibacter tournemirensis]
MIKIYVCVFKSKKNTDLESTYAKDKDIEKNVQGV